MQFTTKHLLGIRDLAPADIQAYLGYGLINSKKFYKDQWRKVPSLRDVTIVNLSLKILRVTRISFELAEKRLSADTYHFTASASSVAKGETLLDTVNNILSLKVDMVVMRHSASGAPHFLATYSGCHNKPQATASMNILRRLCSMHFPL